jgi:hypothetical protein
MDGQCLHVDEYLAAPRVLFCSKCNEPGHNKKQCTFPFERCKRCGKDRKNGEHKDCAIKCHNCSNYHMSTDYKCPAIKCYRRDLIQHLQQHPEALPDDLQLFIPSQYRRQGEKTLVNRNTHQRHFLNAQYIQNRGNAEQWPDMPPPTRPPIYKTYAPSLFTPNPIDKLQVQLNDIEIACSTAKEEYDRKNIEIKSQVKTSIAQIHSLIACFSTIIQKQNETITILKNTIHECLEFNRITNQALCFVIAKSGDQQFVEISKQLSSIPFTERQESIVNLFSTYTPMIDEFMMKLLDVNKQLSDYNV